MGRVADGARVVLPTARAIVRRLRHPMPQPETTSLPIAGHNVTITVGGRHEVLVDNKVVGHVDLRIDLGTSTLEAMGSIDERPDLVLDATATLASHLGLRRVGWSVPSPSPQLDALKQSGFEHEGDAAGPWQTPDAEYELWALVL